MFDGPPPMLKARPATSRGCAAREQERVHEILDEEEVADLLAVAVERDGPALPRLDEEVRDPALVLRAELARSVDAAHPEHRRGRP